MQIPGSVKFGIVGLFLLIGFLALNPFVLVEAGHRGVFLNWGAVTTNVVAEGLSFRIPVMQRVVMMDVRIQKEQVEASAATRDLQSVSSTVALNFHLDPTKVAQIYQEIGLDYIDSIISPVMQEAIKSSTSRYTAEELITKREVVRDDIKNIIKEKMTPKGIMVDEFNIVNFSFSQSFEAAIEAKVTAEQDALAAKNKLDQVKFEAEQRVAEAQAEAEAIKIQAQAIQQQGGANYVQLQAIQKWDGKLPTSFIPGSTLPFLNIVR